MGVRLAALGVGLVVTCLAAELAVLLLVGEQPKFPRRVVGAPWGLRYNEPGARYRHKSADVSVRFEINRNGMRSSEDHAHTKPAGVRRIVSLGDSFTIGYEVAVEDCFSSILERELRAAGHEVEVLNAGVSGFSNAEECLYLERELIRYDPDLVIVSFFGNDLADNVRTGLFALEGDRLVEAAASYVPAGRLGDFLNTSAFFNLLSERSNAFVYLKERATLFMKAKMVRENEANLRRSSAQAAASDGAAPAHEFGERLTAAIFERMYAFLSARGIPLLVHSIPTELALGGELVEQFPLQLFDVDRPGLAFLASKELLDPFAGKELRYWQRSHYHWTPFSHAVAARAAARLITERGLLD